MPNLRENFYNISLDDFNFSEQPLQRSNHWGYVEDLSKIDDLPQFSTSFNQIHVKSEDRPEPNKTNPEAAINETKTYKKRWYILFVFSTYVTIQYFIWNTFGPIASSMKSIFDWENSDVALLANWDASLYVVFSMQICWCVQKTGLRKSFLLSLLFVVIGAILRCVAVSSPHDKWIMNSGQILNGLGGMLAQAAGPFVSNTWFPPTERTTATALSTLAAQFGLALSFIVGPWIVDDLPMDKNVTRSDNQHEMKDDLRIFMYAELAFTVVLLITALVYFPNKPKVPPSNSASLPKLDFRGGFWQLVHKKQFWLILVIAASSTGIYSGWNAVLYLNLKDHGLEISQEDCGWIGFSSTIFSVVGGVGLGYLSDRFPGRIRLFLMSLFAVAVAMFAWVTLICLQVTSFSLGVLYIPCLVGGFCINGAIPLMYELIIELTYPVPETVSIGFLGVINNVFTSVFLLLLNVPNIGVSWMNWCLLATCVTSLLLLFIFQEKYERMRVDDMSTSSLQWALEKSNRTATVDSIKGKK